MRFFRNSKIILILIFLIGIFLRFFMLGENPPSLNWDEVSTGYNAYSILKTGRDEYGNFLPLSIRSFDDYKPPFYTYLTVPAIALFGLTEFAVRLPSAILGSFSIIILFFLTKEFLQGKKISEKNTIYISYLASFLFAISPWSLQFSRAAYEGNVGLFFLLAGILFLFKFLKSSKYIFVSVVFFTLSLYSYHSFRLIIPLFLVGYGILYFREIIKRKIFVLFAVLILAILSIPIYGNFFLSGEGAGSRLAMVTIFGDTSELRKSIQRFEYDMEIGNPLGYVFENRRFVYLLAVIKGYLEHYNPGFLFIYGDGGVQHHAVDFGMLYLFSLPFILVGVYFLIRNFSKRILVLLLLMFFSPVASAVSSGAPHPVRAIVMAPIFDIFFAVGIFYFFKALFGIRGKLYSRIIIALVLLLFTLNLLYYFHQYYIHTPREYGYFWQYGTKQAVNYAYNNKDKYNKVIITYKYDQPYAFYLYYNKIDPSWYQNNWNFTGNGIMPRFERKFDNLEFRNINFGEDRLIPNALLIGTPEEIPDDENVVSEIHFLDGSTAYRIYETGK